MAASERMATRRRERRNATLAAARELAEADGWASVTSRRLADAIDYTPPVIYADFGSMEGVVDAVAVEGFREFAQIIAAARATASTGELALEATCRAYLAYADAHPALYDAMFVRGTKLAFAEDDTLPELLAAFAQLRAAVEPFSEDADTLAEVVWASLHGLALLQGGRRIPGNGEARVASLLRLVTT